MPTGIRIHRNTIQSNYLTRTSVFFPEAVSIVVLEGHMPTAYKEKTIYLNDLSIVAQ